MKKWFSARWLPFWVLGFCAVALNINTIGNKYAMDDDLVILNNLYVQEGAAGIGSILSSDAFQSYFDQLNAESPLGGGRYRPLSIVSFAVEQQLFGKTRGGAFAEKKQELFDEQQSGRNPEREKELSRQLAAETQGILDDNARIAPIRHAFQVLFFMLAVLALYRFLSRYLLPTYPQVAFVAVLLFVFHPVHTEVVANLKSRDEIFSLLFISLSFSAFFRYVEQAQKKDLYTGAGMLLLALLSKEYALIFFILLPIGIMLRYGKGYEVLKSRWFAYTLAITLLFIAVRALVVASGGGEPQDPDLLNDPFLAATPGQKAATKVYLLNQYLRLLVFPRVLSYDYSYNHFPYLDFTDYRVWLSLITWLGIAAAAIVLWVRKHILAFAFALFLGPFMLVNNLLFGIGATMGERLIFHSSAGFCIIAAWLLVKGIERVTAHDAYRKAITVSALLLVCVPMAYKTIARNALWKDNYTLQTRDVYVVPNSALANSNAGAVHFNKGYRMLPQNGPLSDADRAMLKPYADSGIRYLTRALTIHPGYVIARMNRAICYANRGELDSAAYDWVIAARHYHHRNPALVRNAIMLYDKGVELGQKNDYDGAIKYLRLGTQVDSANARIWYNLGGAFFVSNRFPEAAEAFRQAMTIDPRMQEAVNGYYAAMEKSRK